MCWSSTSNTDCYHYLKTFQNHSRNPLINGRDCQLSPFPQRTLNQLRIRIRRLPWSWFSEQRHRFVLRLVERHFHVHKFVQLEVQEPGEAAAVVVVILPCWWSSATPFGSVNESLACGHDSGMTGRPRLHWMVVYLNLERARRSDSIVPGRAISVAACCPGCPRAFIIYRGFVRNFTCICNVCAWIGILLFCLG